MKILIYHSMVNLLEYLKHIFQYNEKIQVVGSSFKMAKHVAELLEISTCKMKRSVAKCQIANIEFIPLGKAELNKNTCILYDDTIDMKLVNKLIKGKK